MIQTEMRKIISYIFMFYAISVSAGYSSQFEKAISEMNEKSLPQINVEVDVASLSKEKYIKGKITIFDNENRIDGKQLAVYDCKVRYRGSSSLKYEKKSFAIKLLDENGEDLDANIFNIRKENDWILDAMAIDRIRMRNRVCFDIWNEISKTPYETDFGNRNGTKGEYVEVYLNGNYHGLYCMSDKIDRKLLGLKKAKKNADGNVDIRGVLYKGENWTFATQLWGYESTESTDNEIWNGWELQYPDDYPCYEVWAPLMGLIDLCNADENTFKNDYRKYFYYDNLIDYIVFLMSLNIIDNNMKNTHLSCPDINKNNTFLITPWDLDCSLGGLYDGSHYEEYTKEGNLINNRIYYNLYTYNIDDFREDIKERWVKYSSGVLSYDNFCIRLDAYAKRFKESGAWQREYEKWNNNPVPLELGEELEYVKNWYTVNMSKLNGLLGIDTYISHIVSDVKNSNIYYYGLDGIKIMSRQMKRIYIIDGKKIMK